MQRTPGQAGPERLPFVEGLRGIAALYVVLGHFCSMADPSRLAGHRSHAPQWFQALVAPFAYGHLAVAAFIVISGFCLQLSLFTNGDGRIPSLPKFYFRRARRILPTYYACLFFSILVSLFITSKLPGMPFEQYLPVTKTNVLAHVFMIHNLSPNWMYKLNGVLWSIAIEAQLYVVFPVLVHLISKLGRGWTISLTGLITSVALLLIPGGLKLYPWYLPLFTIGMVAGWAAYRPNLTSGPKPGVAKFLTVAGCVALGLGIAKDVGVVATDVAIGFIVATICYGGTVVQSGLLVRALSFKWIAALGTFSYSLYLMHHPIQQVVYFFKPASIVGEGPVLAYLFAAGLPTILVLTWLFSLVFEKPFIRKPRARAVSPRLFSPLSLPLQAAQTEAQKQEQAPSEPRGLVQTGN